MCPVCGTTLELASDSPQAIDERETIRELIAEGFTKEEIKDELVAEFGPEVLAEPSKERLRPRRLARPRPSRADRRNPRLYRRPPLAW